MALALGLGMNANAAEPVFPSDAYVFAFSANGGETWEYFTPQDQYLFQAEEGKTGMIKFNADFPRQDLDVQGRFMMVGENFQIDTAGKNVTFDQPMGNFDTNFTVTGAGSVTTQSDAAFKSLTVESGSLTINSQIGVTNQIAVQSGAKLTLADTGRLLLTNQIANNGGTVEIKGILDVSNISAEAAQSIGISFVNLEGKEAASGYLKAGEWKITSGNGTTTASENAKLVVADKQFTINQETGNVTIDATPGAAGGAYQEIWFQNEGTLPAISPITQTHTPVTVMLNSSGEKQTVFTPEGSFMYPVYVASGTNARINLYETGFGGLKDIKFLNESNVIFSPIISVDGQLDTATFIGRNITLTTQDDLGMGTDFIPLNLIVETASSATINADISFYYGAFEDISYKTGAEASSGHLTLRGTLTVGSDHSVDLRKVSGNGSEFSSADHDDGTYAYDVSFEEQFAHLTIAEDAALVLEEDAVFLASSVTDDSKLTADGQNLDTSRHSAQAKLLEDKKIEPPTVESYEINGTVFIKGVEGQTTTVTALYGEESQHYTTRNKLFQVSNAEITVTDDIDAKSTYMGTNKDTTISNVLVGDSVINDKQNGGTVTLDNEKNRNFNTIHAKEGDIAITNREAIPVVIDDEQTWKPEDVSAHNVLIGAGKTVSATGSVEDVTKKATLNVDTLLQADGTNEAGYSKIDANLNLAGGATLNVSAANGTGGVDMLNNEVKFDLWNTEGETLLTLSPQDNSQAWALNPGGMYDLFHNVSAFDFGWGSASPDAVEPWELDASIFFSNFKEGWFYLCYSGADGKGGAGENVGTIYLYSVVPEPATGTLSLLALAALAARRRRK